MAEKLELIADNKSIELCVNNEKWCNVVLNHGSIDELGADSKDIVVQRFLSILYSEKFPESSHELEGYTYSCFIMLFEKHASGYARITDNGVTIHFRNSEGHKIDDINLSCADCNQWKKLLEDFK